MEEKLDGTLLELGSRLLLAFLFAVLSSSALRAQDIRIKLLDGRNGHPLTDCLGIWTSSDQRRPLWVRTDKDGIVILHLGDERAVPTSEPNLSRCKDTPTFGSISHAETIAAVPDWDVDCQTFDKSKARTKFYPVDEILKGGAAAIENSCGKFRMEPMRGELILFARPPHWWESFKR
jgi:hypothetical protein